MSETYVTSNKVVAEFSTVGDFWQVYTHFRRPAVMPLGTFLHFVSIFYDAIISHFSLLMVSNLFGKMRIARMEEDSQLGRQKHTQLNSGRIYYLQWLGSSLREFQVEKSWDL